MNKKGLELAINTIVIFILAIVLLVSLILFFTNSSTSFLDRIRSFTSYSNVDEVVSGCNLLVNSQSSYAFCCEKKNVKYYMDGERTEGDFSCSEMSENNTFGEELKVVKRWDCSEVKC